MGHYIELVIEDGAPKVRFRCDYPEDAFCRRWPLDKNVEEWFEDEPLDAGGHQCSTEAWIEDLGIEEGLMGKDQVLASIPVRVGFDDGPVITRVFSLEAQHQATALEAAATVPLRLFRCRQLQSRFGRSILTCVTVVSGRKRNSFVG